jgi:hypothetical protein
MQIEDDSLRSLCQLQKFCMRRNCENYSDEARSALTNHRCSLIFSLPRSELNNSHDDNTIKMQILAERFFSEREQMNLNIDEEI